MKMDVSLKEFLTAIEGASEHLTRAVDQLKGGRFTDLMFVGTIANACFAGARAVTRVGLDTLERLDRLAASQEAIASELDGAFDHFAKELGPTFFVFPTGNRELAVPANQIRLLRPIVVGGLHHTRIVVGPSDEEYHDITLPFGEVLAILSRGARIIREHG